MNIRIDTARITGFRGITNLEITLPRIALLIGTNNSGKTSVIKALQLALGDYARHLTDEDFHIDSNDKRCDQILVDIRIIPADDAGSRKQTFDNEWLEEFGDKIQAEANGDQFLALRNQCLPDKVKGGFIVNRFALERWPTLADWQTEKPSAKKKLNKRFDALPFISIDAQRDIHQELKEKSSFVGRVLSSVEYDDKDVQQLEDMVAQINKEAVDKSAPLKGLKTHLDALNQSFQGAGQAELTPFPKKIRDLSKSFSVHFGESESGSFSMEYHGMGTRSWASMLTVKAFIEFMAQKHEEEAKPFFPILAAEEPEAHLHPNAQKTLYKQLIDSKGQVIISTHSPYLAALAETGELRSLSRTDCGVLVKMLGEDLDHEDRRKIRREVIHSRGELLFTKAIVLSEGETEAQALPQLFSTYYDLEPFSLGVNFIGVNGSGAKYRPFLLFSRDFNIPVFIFSDGEEKTTKDLKKHYDKVFGETDIDNSPFITMLNDTDFEGYLFESGLDDVVEKAINNVNGEGYIDSWMDKKQDTPLKSEKTDKPPCETCHQPIFEAPLRNYRGEDGRQKAMLEILDSKKPMYAQAVTEQLCLVGKSRFPSKLIEFFGKVMAEVSG
ncbi:MAG: AAA family ATPase [Pseudomonadota bacterium]